MTNHTKKSGISMCNLSIKLLHAKLYPLLLGLFGLALGFISLAYAFTLHGKSQFIPYLVTVDTQGSILTHGKISKKVQIPDSAIGNFLCEFIEALYTISNDKKQQVDFINKVYSQVEIGSSALLALDEYYTKNDVIKATGNVTTNVFIKSIVRLDENRFQIDFTTHSITSKQSLVQTKNYKSIISFEIKSIEYHKLEDLRLNPLGIFIYHLTTSQKMEAKKS